MWIMSSSAGIACFLTQELPPMQPNDEIDLVERIAGLLGDKAN